MAKKKMTKKPKSKPKLTIREKRLCEIYHSMRKPNKRIAYELAGYECTGETARVEAHRTLRKPHVSKYLKTLIKQQEIRTEIDSDKVLKEIARIALADILPAFNENGTIKNIHDISEDLRRATSELKVVETFEGTGKNRTWTDYIKKIKFWSKDKNVELLMRHLELFLKDKEEYGETLAEQIKKALDNGELE